MKKISLIVMSCMIACVLLANHGIVKGGEMSPKVEDTVSIAKKIADSQWLSNNSDTLEVDTAGEDSAATAAPPVFSLVFTMSTLICVYF